MEVFFFFNDTATTEIYTLSLHDALPICPDLRVRGDAGGRVDRHDDAPRAGRQDADGRHQRVRLGRGAERDRSEEHTSELQSRQYLVCRLLLEKKKTKHVVYC